MPVIACLARSVRLPKARNYCSSEVLLKDYPSYWRWLYTSQHKASVMLSTFTPRFSSKLTVAYQTIEDRTAFVTAVMEHAALRPVGLYVFKQGCSAIPFLVTHQKTKCLQIGDEFHIGGYSSKDIVNGPGPLDSITTHHLSIFSDPDGRFLSDHQALGNSPPDYTHFTEFPKGFTRDQILHWLHQALPQLNKK